MIFRASSDHRLARLGLLAGFAFLVGLDVEHVLFKRFAHVADADNGGFGGVVLLLFVGAIGAIELFLADTAVLELLPEVVNVDVSGASALAAEAAVLVFAEEVVVQEAASYGEEVSAVVFPVTHLDELFLLDFLQLLLAVVHHEFLDAHVAAADADDELAVDDLGEDLLGAEGVLVVSESLNGDRAVQAVDVVGEELVDEVALESFVQLPWLLLLQLIPHSLIPCLRLPHPLGDLL